MEDFLSQYSANTRRNYQSRLSRLIQWVGGSEDDLKNVSRVIHMIEKNASPSSRIQFLLTAKSYSTFRGWDKNLDEYTESIQQWRGIRAADYPEESARQSGGGKINEDDDLEAFLSTIENANTRKNYKSRAKVIMELADVSRISQLKGNIRKTVQAIQQMNKSSETKKAFLVVLARIVDEFEFESRNIVADAMEELSEQVSQERKNNPVRGSNQHEWEDVLKAVKENWDSLNQQGQLLLAVYTGMAPLRGEWATVQLKENDENYIDFKKKQLVLRKFKNIKQMGEKRIDIPPRILVLMLPYHDKDQVYLFEKSSGGSYSQDAFLALVKRNLSQVGTPMGVHDLRRKYETWLQSSDEYNQLSEAMREKLHEELLHTKETAMSYREVKKLKQEYQQVNQIKKKGLLDL